MHDDRQVKCMTVYLSKCVPVTTLIKDTKKMTNGNPDDNISLYFDRLAFLEKNMFAMKF